MPLVYTVKLGIFVMLRVSSGAFSITTYLLRYLLGPKPNMRRFIQIIPRMSIPSCEEVIALSLYYSAGGQHLKRIGLTHFSREQRLSFPMGTLWSLCCSCPFLNPDKPGQVGIRSKN